VKLEVDFEDRKRILDVEFDYDSANPHHEEWIKQAIWKEDAQNESGTYGDWLGKVWDGIISNPTGEAFNIAEDQRKAGSRLVEDGLSKVMTGDLPMGAFNTLMGSMQWVFSPVTGAGQAFVGQPTEAATGMLLEATGVDPEIGVSDIPVVGEGLADWGGDYQLKQLVGDTAAIGAEMVQPGSVVNRLRNVPEHIRKFDRQPSAAAREINELREKYPAVIEDVPKVIEDVPKVQVDEAGNITNAAEAFVPRASVPLTRDIVTNPTIMDKVKILRDSGTSEQRLYKDIGDMMYESIKSGDLPLSSVSRLVKDLDMNPEEFVKAWQVSIKEAGQSLNVLSQAAKQMSKDRNYPPELRSQLDILAKEIARDKSISNVERFFNVLRRVENFRRGMMVSQLATAVRNAGSAVGRITMASFDDAAQSILGGGSMKNMWDSIASDFQALPLIRNKELLNEVLDGNPLTKEKLLYTSVNEAELLGKVSKAVNTANVYQERAFRKYAFQAKLEKLAKESGQILGDMNPERIPKEWLDTATSHALDMTFASSGGKMAKKLVKFYDEFPILYTVSNPFPRFTFANALPFLIEHSPYGLAKALSPRIIDDLAQGNSKAFAKAASRGLIGTALLGQAMDLRTEFGGEKWYELSIPNEDGTTTNIDGRPYAPMTQYLFMAQLIEDMRNPDKISTITAADWTDVLLGMNRVSGTGFILADLIRGKSLERSKEILTKFAADWAGAFSTPLAQVRDIEQAVTGDSRLRDPRGDTLGETIVGTTLKNLPLAHRLLPVRRSPLAQGAIEQESLLGVPGGIAKQLTGLNLKKKNVVQREVDRLDVNYSIWNPRTGNKEMDRRQTAIMGEYSPQMADFIMSDQYQNMNDAQKKVALEEVLKGFKKMALDRLKGSMGEDDPELLRRYMIEQGTTKSQEALLDQMGISP
jgi:hypothetical protein